MLKGIRVFKRFVSSLGGECPVSVIGFSLRVVSFDNDHFTTIENQKPPSISSTIGIALKKDTQLSPHSIGCFSHLFRSVEIILLILLGKREEEAESGGACQY